MIEYLIESTVCSGILYLCYFLCFRRSRKYHVNRAVLLFSVLFFLAAPLLNVSLYDHFEGEVILNGNVSNAISGISTLSNQAVENTKQVYTGFNLSNLLYILYAVITTFLLGRFCFNLYPFISGKFVAEKTVYKGHQLALLNTKISPFSFFRTIYINKDAFKNGEMDDELLLHESGHVRQLHSIDSVLMELVQVFYWFNPFILLFKKLIKTNHEYLADEFVVKSGSDKIAYSNKLINYTTRDKTLNLASGFNYSLIKNRLIMLSKYEQKSKIFYRLALFVPIVITLFATTAFSNVKNIGLGSDDREKPGIFYADTLFWSGENQKVYLQGKVDIKYGENDVQGNGSFSFLGKVNLLVIDGSPAKLNSSIKLSGIKCEIVTLSKEAAQRKYGVEGRYGAVEIRTIE
ncbi:MAG: M56 family metallopeptidase [Bacteroidota bacterium]